MARGVLGAASIPFMGCVTLLLAIILHILAFASPFWAEDSEGQFGLWRVHNCNPEPNAYDNDECYQWNQKWDSAGESSFLIDVVFFPHEDCLLSPCTRRHNSTRCKLKCDMFQYKLHQSALILFRTSKDELSNISWFSYLCVS